MRPKKLLGQNFLQDSTVIDRIVRSLSLTADDTVIEIGPGRGALTEELVATGAKVFAIEIDRELVPVLRTQFHFQTNFSVVEADILSVELTELLPGKEKGSVKLVGNLPYNISTPIIQKLIEQREITSQIVLMLQREVVERLTARPGNAERGFFTVLVEDAFETEKLFDVPPGSFYPAPKVWSSVIKLVPRPVDATTPVNFREVVSLGFSQKRKTILNNLKKYVAEAESILTDAEIAPIRRAETLTLSEWKKLAGNILQKKTVSGKSSSV